MSDVLQVDLPWLILRAKLVQEDAKGILYKTMFTDYILDNSKFQMVLYFFFSCIAHCEMLVFISVQRWYYGRFIHVERYAFSLIQFN